MSALSPTYDQWCWNAVHFLIHQFQLLFPSVSTLSWDFKTALCSPAKHLPVSVERNRGKNPTSFKCLTWELSSSEQLVPYTWSNEKWMMLLWPKSKHLSQSLYNHCDRTRLISFQRWFTDCKEGSSQQSRLNTEKLYAGISSHTFGVDEHYRGFLTAENWSPKCKTLIFEIKRGPCCSAAAVHEWQFGKTEDKVHPRAGSPKAPMHCLSNKGWQQRTAVTIMRQANRDTGLFQKVTS